MVHKKNHAQTSPKTIKLATSIRDGPCFSYSKKYRPGRKEKLQHNSMFQNRSPLFTGKLQEIHSNYVPRHTQNYNSELKLGY
jgi:hypothetical protein